MRTWRGDKVVREDDLEYLLPFLGIVHPSGEPSFLDSPFFLLIDPLGWVVVADGTLCVGRSSQVSVPLLLSVETIVAPRTALVWKLVTSPEMFSAEKSVSVSTCPESLALELWLT